MRGAGDRPSNNTAHADCYAAPLPAREDQDKGLLGNLPHRRPSVQSPRRAEARRAAEQRREAAGATSSRPIEPDSSGSGLEELARTGVGLAVDMAGIGLRLAGRAAGRIGRLTGRD